MKKLLLLLLVLISFTLNAEWVPGTITLKNNTVNTGYIKYFSKANAGKIEFKATLKDKSKSYSSEELKVVEMELKNGNKIKLLRLHTANYTGFKPTLSIKKGYIWFSVNYDGDFQVLSVSVTESNWGFSAMHHSTTMYYYIHWPENDYAVLTSLVGKGSSIVIGNKAYIRKTNALLFKGKCDKMAKALDDKLFTPGSIDDVIEYYEKNCGRENT